MITTGFQTYKVDTRCVNCGQKDTLELPKGRPAPGHAGESPRACKNCGVKAQVKS